MIFFVTQSMKDMGSWKIRDKTIIHRNRLADVVAKRFLVPKGGFAPPLSVGVPTSALQIVGKRIIIQYFGGRERT